MIQRVISHAWSLRREFAKYFIVGFSGVFLDIATLLLFEKVFGVRPVLAVVMNQAILLTYNFTLNKYWSFRSRAMPHKQIVRYLSLAGFNYVFSVAAMYVGNERLGFEAVAVRVATIAVMMSWNFILYKFWVYRDLPARATDRGESRAA